MGDEILKFYSRKDIQKEIVEAAKNREIAVKYKDGNFGKRPDILQYENDVLELAKQGATSFHATEERWTDPLKLQAGMTKSQLDELRAGWDLIIDLDSKFLEYSKTAASLVVEALKFNNIKNIFVKYSGSNGFHIGIPFEAFPAEVNNQETRLLFPEGVKIIASYLKQMIKKELANKILELSTIEEISKSLNKKIKEFDPFSVIDIDTALISNRHMFRLPYSINEKKDLVSIPIKPKQISRFKPSQAKMENVTTEIKFLDTSKIEEPEASQLIMQAFDWQKKKPEIKVGKEKKEIYIPKRAVSEEFFPPCVKLALAGIKQDGRKRTIFILTNFLKRMGYGLDEIEKMLLKWNKKNYEVLRDGYIISQINWHRKQKKNILPPNCDNKAYYSTIGICNPDSLCKLIKNPVNYTLRRLRILKQNENQNKSKRYRSQSRAK